MALRTRTRNLNVVTISTPRKGDKTTIDVRNKTEEFVVLNEKSATARKTNISVADSENSYNQNEAFCFERNEHSYNNDYWTDTIVYKRNHAILLPPTEPSTIALSTSRDMIQAIVVKFNTKEEALIVICKCKFVESTGWIAGCSFCVETMLEFKILANGSQTVALQDKPSLFKCKHILQATSFILSSLMVWKPKITGIEVEDLLEKHCNVESNANFFYSDKYQDYCGGITTEKKLYLFVFKNSKWRCTAHNNRPTYRCNCGEVDELPLISQSPTETKRQCASISGSPIIEKNKFSVEALRPIFQLRSTSLTETVLKQFKATSIDNPIEVKPEIEFCPNCSSSELIQKIKTEKGVFLLRHLINCKIYVYRCAKCNEEIPFRGTTLGYVNWKNCIIIGIEMIEKYMQMNSKTGVPFSTWFKDVVESNDFLEGNIFKCTKNLLSHLGYLHEVFCLASELFIFPPSVFKCCESPRILSMDGVVISTKTSRIPEYLKPWLKDVINVRASKRTDRQLEPVPKNILDTYKKLLKSGLSNDEISMLKRSSHIGITVLMYCLSNDNPEQTWYVLDGAKSFANTLLKNVAPVASLIPAKSVDICKRIADTETLLKWDELKIFSNYSPILTSLYQTFIEKFFSDKEAMFALRSLFKTLLTIREKTFDFDESSLFSAISDNERCNMFERMPGIENAPSLSQAELQLTGFYFPEYPVIRKMPEVKISGGKDINCNKIAHKKGILGPGVLLVCCLDHNCCIGFVILDASESCKLVTEIIVTRFKIAPEVIVYDNCCNLAEYQFNRFPNFFQNTMHLVDGFHYYSHVGCSESFNSGAYSKLMYKVNTSLLEQNNSKLAVLKSVAPYLKIRTLGDKLRYSTMSLNLSKQEKTQNT